MSFFQVNKYALVQHTRRHWLSGAFVAGFVTDLLLLNRIDDLFDNLILLTYVILATLSLLLFYVGVSEKVSPKVAEFLTRYMPIAVQYGFGGLLSGMLIFYGRSGDLIANAPFLLLLACVVAGNELITKRSNRLVFNITIYFVGVFAYLVLIVPVVVGRMNEWIFILSGLLALGIIGLFLKLLGKIIPHFLDLHWRDVVAAVGGVYALFNLLYFFNVIPPIPLSLTELHIYHGVEKTTAQSYRVVEAKEEWWQLLPFMPKTFHPEPGGGVFCFARVYAPTRLTTNITHVWEYFDDEESVWREHFRLAYPLSSPNERGYGGYTEIRSWRDGQWRCSVATERGQILGRITFTIDSSRSPGLLETRIE